MYKIRNWGNTLKKELKGMKSTKTKKIRREDIPNLETSERRSLDFSIRFWKMAGRVCHQKKPGGSEESFQKNPGRMRLGIYNNITNFKKCEYFATFVEKALYV